MASRYKAFSRRALKVSVGHIRIKGQEGDTRSLSISITALTLRLSWLFTLIMAEDRTRSPSVVYVDNPLYYLR